VWIWFCGLKGATVIVRQLRHDSKVVGCSMQASVFKTILGNCIIIMYTLFLVYNPEPISLSRQLVPVWPICVE